MSCTPLSTLQHFCSNRQVESTSLSSAYSNKDSHIHKRYSQMKLTPISLKSADLSLRIFKTYFLSAMTMDSKSNVSTNAKVPLPDMWTPNLLNLLVSELYIYKLRLFIPSELYTLKATWNLVPQLKW